MNADGERLGAALLRQLDAVNDLLQTVSADRWATPTRCDPWNVAQLAAHVALPAAALANGLVALRSGAPTSLGGQPLPEGAPPHEILQTLTSRRVALAEQLTQLDSRELSMPLPPPPETPLSLPAETLMKLALVELGVHRNDLEAALGLDASLDRDVVDAVGEVVPTWLIFNAADAARPENDLSYRLVGQRLDVTLSYSAGQGWHAGTGVSECRIEGADTDLALFLLGRVSGRSTALRVVGDDRDARAFKTFLPGP